MRTAGRGDRRDIAGIGNQVPGRPPLRPAVSVAGRGWQLAAVGAGAALVALGALVLAGPFSGDDVKGTGVAAYRSAVSGYCRLALGGQGAPAGSDAQNRARAYLEVIETVRGRVDSLPPPDGSDRSLDRFRSGLTTAADFTSVVAEDPPRAGIPRSRPTSSPSSPSPRARYRPALSATGSGPPASRSGTSSSRSARNAAHLP